MYLFESGKFNMLTQQQLDAKEKPEGRWKVKGNFSQDLLHMTEYGLLPIKNREVHFILEGISKIKSIKMLGYQHGLVLALIDLSEHELFNAFKLELYSRGFPVEVTDDGLALSRFTVIVTLESIVTLRMLLQLLSDFEPLFTKNIEKALVDKLSFYLQKTDIISGWLKKGDFTSVWIKGAVNKSLAYQLVQTKYQTVLDKPILSVSLKEYSNNIFLLIKMNTEHLSGKQIDEIRTCCIRKEGTLTRQNQRQTTYSFKIRQFEQLLDLLYSLTEFNKDYYFARVIEEVLHAYNKGYAISNNKLPLLMGSHPRLGKQSFLGKHTVKSPICDYQVFSMINSFAFFGAKYQGRRLVAQPIESTHLSSAKPMS